MANYRVDTISAAVAAAALAFPGPCGVPASTTLAETSQARPPAASGMTPAKNPVETGIPNMSESSSAVWAAERVAAGAAVAHRGPTRLVLTARAENYLHGRQDLADTIARLQSYQEAGADVLFAPGVMQLDDLRQLVASVDRPVNVLALPLETPPVAELASIGVRRISVGSEFAFAALGAVVEAARELREQGTYGFWMRAMLGMATALPAFRS